MRHPVSRRAFFAGSIVGAIGAVIGRKVAAEPEAIEPLPTRITWESHGSGDGHVTYGGAEIVRNGDKAHWHTWHGQRYNDARFSDHHETTPIEYVRLTGI